MNEKDIQGKRPWVICPEIHNYQHKQELTVSLEPKQILIRIGFKQDLLILIFSIT